jgi:hypothetical protein
VTYYYETPNYSVALNAKVGSSSIARAIIRQFQPREDWLIRTAAFPSGVTEDNRQWHWLAKGSLKPTKPVVLLVRDPVDRFVTACQQIQIQDGDIDSAIASLVDDAVFARTKPPGQKKDEWDAAVARRAEARHKRELQRLNLAAAGKPVGEKRDKNRLRQNVHFFFQSDYIVGPTTCFRFPGDISEAAKFLGIAAELPVANKAKRPKARLTGKQEDAVRAYYAADVSLFESISQPATVVLPAN